MRRRGVEVEVFGFPPRQAATTSRRRGGCGALLRRERFDLVHAHYGLAGWCARLAGARPLRRHLPRHRRAPPAWSDRCRAAWPGRSTWSPRVSRALFAPEDGRPGLPARPRRRGAPLRTRPRPLPARCREPRRDAALGLDPDGRYLLFPANPARPEKRHDRAAELAARLRRRAADRRLDRPRPDAALGQRRQRRPRHLRLRGLRPGLRRGARLRRAGALDPGRHRPLSRSPASAAALCAPFDLAAWSGRGPPPPGVAPTRGSRAPRAPPRSPRPGWPSGRSRPTATSSPARNRLRRDERARPADPSGEDLSAQVEEAEAPAARRRRKPPSAAEQRASAEIEALESRPGEGARPSRRGARGAAHRPRGGAARASARPRSAAIAAAESRLAEIEAQAEAAEKRIEAAERAPTRAAEAEGASPTSEARAREAAAAWLREPDRLDPPRGGAAIAADAEFDVAVVGGGAAGLWTALRAAGGRRRRLPGLAHAALPERQLLGPGRPGRGAGAGRLSGPARRRHDRRRSRALPSLGGRGAGRGGARRRCASCASAGSSSTSTHDGELALGLEGGHTRRRIVHSGGSQTGHEITSKLAAMVAAEARIEVREQHLGDGALERRRALPRRAHRRRRRSPRRRPCWRPAAPRRCGGGRPTRAGRSAPARCWPRRPAPTSPTSSSASSTRPRSPCPAPASTGC